MDRIGRKLGNVDPFRRQGNTDLTVEEMEDTVEQFYQNHAVDARDGNELLLDNDLKDIFNVSSRKRKGVRPAVDFLRENRKVITDKLTYWTGVQRPLIKNLLEAIEKRLTDLNLKAEVNSEKQHLTELTVFCTAMAMNYLSRGKFVQS
jgi:hypothetical protein